MVRPKKCRFVKMKPEVLYFKPRAVPLKDLEEVTLKVEELEAVRLKNLEGLDQEKAAEKMEVSRSTFRRILKSAEKKTADFLVNGKGLKIEGGYYVTGLRKFACENCGHQWREPYGKGRPKECPECGSPDVKSEHRIESSSSTSKKRG